MSVHATGTQTATINTKHTLSSPVYAGIYTLLVDTTNMASGDTLEIAVEISVVSGGLSRVIYLASYSGAQTTEPAKTTIPVTAPYGGSVSIKQTAGTGRSYEWTLVAN